MTVPNRSGFRFQLLQGALLTSALLIGCHGPAARPGVNVAAGADPCESIAAAMAGAATTGCTLAQRICLIVRDVPGVIKQADFVPEKSYAVQGHPHVSAWRTQLAGVAQEAALAPFVQFTQQQLDWLEKSEKDRRLVVENGDLLHALRNLIGAAKEIVPSPGLGCTLEP
jgi:hypothetical protein